MLNPGDPLPQVKKRMTQETINAYAAVSGDMNPLHIDPDYARGTPFGGTIAHGHISVAYLCELLTGSLGRAFLCGGRLMEVKFIAPVRPGDEVLVGGEVIECEEKEVVYSVWVKRADGQKCVTGKAVIKRTAGSR